MKRNILGFLIQVAAVVGLVIETVYFGINILPKSSLEIFFDCLCGFVFFIGVLLTFSKKKVYVYPKNGDKIIFISSNTFHKSTAYKGWTGEVEYFTLSDGFIIKQNDGRSLICGLSSRKKTLLTWCYADDTTCTEHTSLFTRK